MQINEQSLTPSNVQLLDRTTPIGKSISAYLNGDSELEDHVIHLLFSANRWEAAPQIREDIAKGITLVIDRYFYSGVVYSVAKANPRLCLEWARHPEVGLPLPDLCIFLDISSQDAAKRAGYGTEKYENHMMQERVRVAFNRLFSLPRVEDVVIINAGMPLVNVEEHVLEEAISCLEKLDSESPLRSLGPMCPSAC